MIAMLCTYKMRKRASSRDYFICNALVYFSYPPHFAITKEVAITNKKPRTQLTLTNTTKKQRLNLLQQRRQVY